MKTTRALAETNACVSVADMSPTALVVESGAALRAALAEVLRRNGYKVDAPLSVEEARQLMHTRSYDRIYGDDRVSLSPVARGAAPAGAHVRVEDLQNGTARVRLNQIVPWPAAIEIVDIAAGAARQAVPAN